MPSREWLVLVELIRAVVTRTGDAADRAALADLLEDLGRSDEAELVRSGASILFSLEDETDTRTMRVVPGVWRPEELVAPVEDSSAPFDFFADE
jgi:uncharacterized protein (TIGR02996 family)